MITIRRVEKKDAQQISAIHVETWKTCYQGLMPAEFLRQYQVTPQNIAHWQDLIAKSEYFYVAENSIGEVVAYLQAGPGRFPHIPCEFEIYSFYVLPAYQHRQIGSRLFAHFYGCCQCQSVFVCVVKGNLPASAFYRRCGAVLYPQYEFVSSTNAFPVCEEVFVWGTPGKPQVLHQPGAAANPATW